MEEKKFLTENSFVNGSYKQFSQYTEDAMLQDGAVKVIFSEKSRAEKALSSSYFSND